MPGTKSLRHLLGVLLSGFVPTVVLACTAGTALSVLSPTPAAPDQAPEASAAPAHGAPSPDAPKDPARYAALRSDALDAMQAFANRSARWSPDHRTIVFLSNRSHAWRAYLSGWLALDLPPRQVPGPDGSVVDAALTRRGALLLTETDGKRVVTVSPHEAGSFLPWGPSDLAASLAPFRPCPAPNAIAVVAEDQVLFGLSDAPGHVIPLDRGARVSDISPDGRRVLVIDQPATAHARIVEVDRDGRRRERFAGGEKTPADFAIYAPDGETILFASNRSDEPGRVFRRGKRPGPPVQVFQSQDASVRIVGMTGWSRSLRVGVLTESAAGREVSLIKPSGHGQPTRVKLPPGVGTLDSFSPNGRVLTITWETPEGPSDIWEVSTGRGAALRPLRNDVRPRLARLEPLRWRQVEISEAQASFSASVYEPAGSKPPLGALLVLGEQGHAASWRPAIRFLVGIGFVVIEPTERPSSSEQVARWMSVLEAWVPAQGWGDRMAVLARSPTGNLVLDAVAGAKHPWAVVVNPCQGPWEARGNFQGRDVLVVGEDKVDATQQVSSLRSARAAVEHAVCDQEGCWAREALFLERYFQGSTKGDG